MAKKKSLEEVYFPVPQNMSLSEKPPLNKSVIQLIVRSTLKGAYRLTTPDGYGYTKRKSIATDDQIEMVTHLIEAIQPADAIEATLASQYVITYIRGLENSMNAYSNSKSVTDLFGFGHRVLEALQKYRSKGTQQISVQYNLNQQQIVNVQGEKFG